MSAPFPKIALEDFAAAYDSLAEDFGPDSIPVKRAAVYRQAISAFEALESTTAMRWGQIEALREMKTQLQQTLIDVQDYGQKEIDRLTAQLSALQERAAAAERRFETLKLGGEVLKGHLREAESYIFEMRAVLLWYFGTTEPDLLRPPPSRRHEMADIRVTMKDGTVKNFPHQNRAGGSWINTVRYEGAFAIVKDVWGNETAIPAADIAEVYREGGR